MIAPARLSAMMKAGDEASALQSRLELARLVRRWHASMTARLVCTNSRTFRAIVFRQASDARLPAVADCSPGTSDTIAAAKRSRRRAFIRSGYLRTRKGETGDVPPASPSA